jgi:hypothetical protein
MKWLKTLVVVLLVALSVVTVHAQDGPVTKDYGDFTLPGGGWLMESWDLTKGDVTVSYTLDLSGAPNVAYTGNYGQSGQVGLMWWGGGPAVAGALMSGFLADWDNAGTEFPTYPDNDNSQDLDDKFNLQRFPNPGSWSETQYDVVFGDPITVYPSPIGSGDNYGIWFDRDGVDQWQATGWGAVDGGTYNTGGVYKVQLTFHKLDGTTGVVQPLLFPDLANGDAPGGYGVPTGFNRLAGGGYEYFPAGISFETDETKMAAMRVLVQGSPGNGTIAIRDLEVTGYPSPEGGFVTGGGWIDSPVNTGYQYMQVGGKANFRFVSKYKKGASVPDGNTEFVFKAGDLSFHSTTYQWLVVNAGGTRAQFKGYGTISDTGHYSFMIWAGDGDPDTFRIKIWTDDDSETVVYDNGVDQAIGGGSIVVHTK